VTPRRLTAGVLVGLTVAALGLSGCGVPTSSGVEHIGPGPEAGSRSPGEGRPPPTADAADTPREQVDNFLQAAAGNPESAADRVREFLRGSDQPAWRPDPGIRVLRLLQEPFITDDVDGGWRVELTAQVVGELHPNGYLDAPTATEQVDYEFRVVTEGAPGGDVTGESLRLRIADPPPHLLLVDTALANQDYYYPNPIYFWNADHEVLVPDLRWLPLAGEPVDQHPWTVVTWLLNGPAPSLSRLQGLPPGTQHLGTPVWEDNRLVVDFNAAALEGQTPDEFATQLGWSLLQLREGAELELRIDGRAQQIRVRPRSWVADPVRFVVLDGVIHELAASGTATTPPVLVDEINRDVRAAALTRDGRVAALVRDDPAGQRLTVARAESGAEPEEVPVGLVAAEIGQPVWLSTAGTATGLVVADGRLYRFTAAGASAAVTVPGLAGPITALALAPERQRLALIAADRLYVALLDRDGESLTVHPPRVLPTTLRELAGVAFSHEDRLVVAGERDGRVGLYELAVDGGVEDARHDLSNASVTALVAHPTTGDAHATIMYEANGQAYSFTGVPILIRAEDLADPPEDPGQPPLAPFFLG
jgi:hypothetical protein